MLTGVRADESLNRVMGLVSQRKLLFNWKRLYEEGLLNDEDLQECQAVPVAITETLDPSLRNFLGCSFAK